VAAYAYAVLALLLVALSLGLSNFAASIAIGTSGVNRALRVRIAVAFGLFEAGMPIIGLLVGRHVAHALGSAAQPIAGGLLVVTGAYTVVQARTVADAAPSMTDVRGGQVLLMAASLSVDNLILGFALGARHVSLVPAISVIAAVSVGLSLIGLQLGAQLGSRIEQNSEVLAGAVLICVGAAIAAGLL
jgi:manganese efflux pump family protein